MFILANFGLINQNPKVNKYNPIILYVRLLISSKLLHVNLYISFN